MKNETAIKQWRKYRRQSISALPVLAGMLLVICGVLFVLSRFVSIPFWVTVVLVGVSAFTVIG